MQKRWYKFTISELGAGELDIRDMSKKAQEAYRGTDLIGVAKYIEYVEDSNEVSFDGYKLEKYAITYDGIYAECDLTFEELQKELEDYYDAINEEDE